MTWQFYADDGLTIDWGGGIPFTQAAGGAPVSRVLYYGNPTPGKTLQAASSPGNDPITITPADTAPGSGVENSMVKIALSAIGLDSATAGAPVNVGNSLTSGTVNAVAVHVRIDAGGLSNGTYTDAGLEVVATVET